MSTQQNKLGQALNRLSVGFIIIAAVSAFISPIWARVSALPNRSDRIPKVALVHTSIDPLDQGVQGI